MGTKYMHWGILGAPKTFYGAWGSRQMPGLPNSTARHYAAEVK